MKKFYTAAVVFALLSVTAPAHAATIGPTDALDITFANGDTLSGEIGWWFDVYTPGFSFPFPGPSGLEFNGGPFFGPQGAPNGYTINGPFASVYAVLADVPDLTPNEFFLNSSFQSIVNGTPDGSPGIGGTVSCVSGCSVGATPLPAALLLFGSGLLALAGFAWWRKITSASRV